VARSPKLKWSLAAVPCVCHLTKSWSAAFATPMVARLANAPISAVKIVFFILDMRFFDFSTCNDAIGAYTIGNFLFLIFD
jgi:hypothetical protein